MLKSLELGRGVHTFLTVGGPAIPGGYATDEGNFVRLLYPSLESYVHYHFSEEKCGLGHLLTWEANHLFNTAHYRMSSSLY